MLEPKSPPIARVKSSHITLTSATVESLRKAIQEEKFPPGSQLPPELELMNILGVSRTTLREALRTLEEQGFIIRRRGLGTYVSEKSIIKDISINFGISEMITQAGLTPGTLEAFVRKDRASASIAASLEISENDPVVIVDRVRTANNRPVVWSLDILSAALLGEHSIETLQLESYSLYQYLEEKLQIQVTRGVCKLKPIGANAEMVLKLNVRPGTPLMCINQTDYDARDRPVLHSIEYHLPDAFVFLVNRRGPHW